MTKLLFRNRVNLIFYTACECEDTVCSAYALIVLFTVLALGFPCVTYKYIFSPSVSLLKEGYRFNISSKTTGPVILCTLIEHQITTYRS
jgi:hypothetical protein